MLINKMGIYKPTLQKELNKLNCDLEETGGKGEAGSIYVYPPEGKRFGCTGGKVLAYQYSNGDQSWKPEVYEEILFDLELGLRDDNEC